MIAIIDYGMGNLLSVQNALKKMGAETLVTHNQADLLAAQKIVLPGVGAMKSAMERLNHIGLIEIIHRIIEEGTPFLGICLGLQILFDMSTEGGHVKGLGILKGSVERFQQLKVPHMGWNNLKLSRPQCPILKDIEKDAKVYFCHSYYVKPTDPSVIAAQTDYGIEFVSAIWRQNVFGVQFHPEKSQSVGLKILKNFVELPE